MHDIHGTRLDLNGADTGQDVIRHMGHTIYQQAGGPLEEHLHRGCFEIAYLDKGRMHWWAGDPNHTFVMHAGDFFTVPAGLKHGSINGIHESCNLYWMVIDAHILHQDKNFDNQFHNMLWTYLNRAPQHCLGDPQAVVHFENLLYCLQNPDPFITMRVRSALYQLLLLVCDSLAEDRKLANMDHAAITTVLQSIKCDITAVHTVKDMATMAEMSPNHFINKFREATGYSPIDYLNREKVHMAQDLLSHTQRSIIDIALSLNFSSSQYFSSVFKKYIGMTPTAYRNLKCSKSND